jgi:tripartite-type tricarboxylate transporter receptor subunit TctC
VSALPKRLGRFAILAVFALLLGSAVADAQTSGRPITIVVPYSPGTGQDVLARLLGEELQKKWGQAVVVDNKPGANGVIGSQAVARAAPDGHTLLLTSTSFTTNLSLQKHVPYDPVKSFAPIAELAVGHLALGVHPSVPANTTQEFIAYAKNQPGKLNYSSPGVGGPHHLAMELFKQSTKTELTHIPYKGTAGAVADLLGGHVNAGFVAIHVVMPMLNQIRLLGAAAKERPAVLPELKTLDEQGVSGFNVTLWYALFAPAGTPTEIVARYNGAINEVLTQSQVVESLNRQGLTVVRGGPERLSQLVQREIDVWQKVVKEAGITAE